MEEETKKVIDPTTGEEYKNIVGDEFLRNNLDIVRKDLRKDYDCFFVISGREGYGKSTLAAQIALYLDPTYNLSRCTFTAEQFEQAVLTADKYQAVVFDETMGYLGSRGAMSKFNRRLIKIMSEMRSRNLIVILCIPSFFELDKYPAMHRSTGLIHVPKRGMYQSFDYRKKKSIYIYGKKTYSITAAPSFYGSFTKYFPLEKKAYEEKKQTAIAEWDTKTSVETRYEDQRNRMILYCYIDLKYTQKRIGELIGLTQQQIARILENVS